MSGWLLAIDFGTSFTTAAVRKDGREPQILRFQEGQEDPERLPSLVLVDEAGELRVGEAAWAAAARHPGRLLPTPKAHLGEADVHRIDGRRVSPVEAVAEVLRVVWDEALQQNGDAPDEVRLSHPASWRAPRKQALAEAARLAGIAKPTLMPPEPVAAAVECAAVSTKEGKERVPIGGYAAVYDLGGGTFDAAVVQRTGDHSFEVVGEPRGDDHLGGELFDDRLRNSLLQRLARESEEEAAKLASSIRLRHQFLTNVRRAKEWLSRHPGTDFSVGELDFHLTREELDALIRDSIEESAQILEATVREAVEDPRALAAVFLVGGSSRVQLVADTLRPRFEGKVVAAPGDPKSVVALGAARYAPQPATTARPDPLRQTPATVAADAVALAPKAERDRPLAVRPALAAELRSAVGASLAPHLSRGEQVLVGAVVAYVSSRSEGFRDDVRVWAGGSVGLSLRPAHLWLTDARRFVIARPQKGGRHEKQPLSWPIEGAIFGAHLVCWHTGGCDLQLLALGNLNASWGPSWAWHGVDAAGSPAQTRRADLRFDEKYSRECEWIASYLTSCGLVVERTEKAEPRPADLWIR